MAVYTLVTSINRIAHYNRTYPSVIYANTRLYTHTVRFCYGKTLVTQMYLFGNAPLTAVEIMARTRKCVFHVFVRSTMETHQNGRMYHPRTYAGIALVVHVCFSRFPIDNDVITLIIYYVSKTTATATTFAYAAR